jgi:hypothetical protein
MKITYTFDRWDDFVQTKNQKELCNKFPGDLNSKEPSPSTVHHYPEHEKKENLVINISGSHGGAVYLEFANKSDYNVTFTKITELIKELQCQKAQ